jgi:hypothetical protein
LPFGYKYTSSTDDVGIRSKSINVLKDLDGDSAFSFLKTSHTLRKLHDSNRKSRDDVIDEVILDVILAHDAQKGEDAKAGPFSAFLVAREG